MQYFLLLLFPQILMDMPYFLVLFKQEHLISLPSFFFLFAYFVHSFWSKQHVEQKDWQDADEFLMGFSFLVLQTLLLLCFLCSMLEELLSREKKIYCIENYVNFSYLFDFKHTCNKICKVVTYILCQRS